MKYRSKPVEKYALQFIPEKWDESAPPEFHEAVKPNGLDKWAIFTLEGVMEVNPGDYVIRGLKGEFYPCKSDIFEKSYEKVE